MTTSPHRFTYFPPTMIFGKNLVPVYFFPEFGSTIPVKDITASLGVPLETAMKILYRNRDVAGLVDFSTGKAVTSYPKSATAQSQACVGMEGICILIMSLDHTQIKNNLRRERIIVAKHWLLAQISNRVKVPGQKHQPRWDAGLSKQQAKELKKRIAKLQNIKP